MQLTWHATAFCARYDELSLLTPKEFLNHLKDGFKGIYASETLLPCVAAECLSVICIQCALMTAAAHAS